MFRRAGSKPPALEPQDAAKLKSSSNIKMLLIAAAFLMVTIGLMLMQPALGPDPVEVATPVAAPTLDADGPVPAEPPVVTRSDASLLTIDAVPASEAISRELRAPIRLTDTDARRTDLRGLTSAVLARFGYHAGPEDRFHALLVQALTERQSNAYIDALLNTAAARGEFQPPRQLLDPTGRIDTQALLVALVQQSRS